MRDNMWPTSHNSNLPFLEVELPEITIVNRDIIHLFFDLSHYTSLHSLPLALDVSCTLILVISN